MNVETATFLSLWFSFHIADISSAKSIDSNFMLEGAGHHIDVTFIDWCGPHDNFPFASNSHERCTNDGEGDSLSFT